MKTEADTVRAALVQARAGLPAAFRPVVGPALEAIGAELAGIVARMEARIDRLERSIAPTDGPRP